MKMNRRHPRLAACALALAAATLSPPNAKAMDFSLSGFATLEYAKSDSDTRYLRFIDKDGTFKAGSLAAVQGDLRLNPQWSATVQLRAAPSATSDSKWELRAPWAFVAWRPDDEWLVRVGKMRIPLFLHSESLNIGVAHDTARLPREAYSIAPNSDFQGLFVTWSRPVGGDGELSVEGYVGEDTMDIRVWSRDGVPGVVPAGAMFRETDVKSAGLVTTWRTPRTVLRLGLHLASVSNKGAEFPVRFPLVTLAPGVALYQVSPDLPGPGIETVGSISNPLLTLAGEHRLGGGWRVAGEVVRLWQRRTELGAAGIGGYAAVYREWGAATPYVSLARSRSDKRQLDWYRRLTTTQLPPMIPGAAQINGSQRLFAESGYVMNQSTLAVGSSYSLGGQGKLKLEWARTRFGEASRLVDTRPGDPPLKGRSQNTWTLSYSVAF